MQLKGKTDEIEEKRENKEGFETKDCKSFYCKASLWTPCRQAELLVKEAIDL